MHWLKNCDRDSEDTILQSSCFQATLLSFRLEMLRDWVLVQVRVKLQEFWAEQVLVHASGRDSLPVWVHRLEPTFCFCLMSDLIYALKNHPLALSVWEWVEKV